MPTTEYPFHSGARVALLVLAILCAILIVAMPFALWVLVRRAGGKVVISEDELNAKSLGSAKYAFRDVARVGVGKVRIIAKGLGGYLAKARMGGEEAVHLVVKTTAGKQIGFPVSQYTDWEKIIAKVGEKTGKQVEELNSGAFGFKFPKLAGE